MSTRLSKREFIYVYFLLFTIAISLTTFFLGAKVGKDHSLDAIQKLEKQLEEMKTGDSALPYAQTDFVHYYYEALLPFQEFRQEYLHLFEAQQGEVNRNAVKKKLEELTKLASETKELMRTGNHPKASPLLYQSKEELLLALNDLELGLSELQASANSQNLTQVWLANANMQSGHSKWLRAQTLFYEALVSWEAEYVHKQSPTFISDIANYQFSGWSALSFHRKNELIAKILENKGIVSIFQPEDVLVYLDSYSNQENRLSDNIGETIELLVAARSIRAGEFQDHAQLYSSLEAPPLPIFQKRTNLAAN